MWTFEWGAKIPKCATVCYPGKPVERAHVGLDFITLKEKSLLKKSCDKGSDLQTCSCG